MWTSILSILAIVAAIVWRYLKKRDDPNAVAQRKNDENAKAATGDQKLCNVLLADKLARIERLRTSRRDTSRQGGRANGS